MEWLSAAAADPRSCKRQWRGKAGTSQLECGRFWDVLSVPHELGVLALHVLLGIIQPPGPTLADGTLGTVSFFVVPEPRGCWIGSSVQYLGKETWITAPAPDCVTGPLRWLFPPDGNGSLFEPAALERSLQLAQKELSATGSAQHAARQSVTGRLTASDNGLAFPPWSVAVAPVLDPHEWHGRLYCAQKIGAACRLTEGREGFKGAL